MKMKYKKHEMPSKMKDIKMSDQNIVEFAYAIKDLISPLCGVKLSHDKAVYYQACFYKMRDILTLMDAEYLDAHKDLVAFYHDGRVRKEKDVLYWGSKNNPIIEQI
ncbi:MAG: hypothetical protein JW925_11110 [Syntrophaceae bacterium]|nr:hypothetical protein [Syntrophaceae bacterium]